MRKLIVLAALTALVMVPVQAMAGPILDVAGQSGIRADNPESYGTGNAITWAGTVGDGGTLRGLQSFDLSNVGPFTVPDATLWYYIDRDDGFANADPGEQTIQVHELDRGFRYAVDGGANWLEDGFGVAWDPPGGDFGPVLASTVLDLHNPDLGDTFTLSSEALREAAQNAVDEERELNLILRAPGLEGAEDRTIVWVQGPEGANPAQLIIPEPATMGLLAIGGLGVLLRRKRS